MLMARAAAFSPVLTLGPSQTSVIPENCAPGLVGDAAAGGPGPGLAQLVKAVRCRRVHSHAHVVPKHAHHLQKEGYLP